MGYSLPSQETEAVTLKDPRRNWEFVFDSPGTHVPIRCELKYLGVIMDHRIILKDQAVERDRY